MTIYDARTTRLLRESGERIDRERREGIRVSTMCGWCRRRLPEHDPRCLDETKHTNAGLTYEGLR